LLLRRITALLWLTLLGLSLLWRGRWGRLAKVFSGYLHVNLSVRDVLEFQPLIDFLAFHQIIQTEHNISKRVIFSEGVVIINVY